MANPVASTLAESLSEVLELVSSSALATQDIVERLGLSLAPSATKESWKYTPVRDFLTGIVTGDAVLPHLQGTAQSGITTSTVTDPNGFTLGPLTAEASDDAEGSPLAVAALLLTGKALHIDVTGEVPKTLEITYSDGVQVPIFINLNENSSLSLIERNIAEVFSNQSLYLNLARGARATHARASFNAGSCDWSLTQAHLQESSSYKLQQYYCGGGKRRSETQILLDGSGATAELIGAFVVAGNTHLDQQLLIEHRAPNTTSRQTFHGIGAGKGTAVFNGRIHIHADSPGSDAQLTNKNLALHPEATINTKPELEIYTDDVKCSHGATVGQLAEDSIFYLQSRGLSRNDATALLCRAFLKSCITGPLADEATRVLLKNLGK